MRFTDADQQQAILVPTAPVLGQLCKPLELPSKELEKWLRARW